MAEGCNTCEIAEMRVEMALGAASSYFPREDGVF